jgi:hypothetical protein
VPGGRSALCGARRAVSLAEGSRRATPLRCLSLGLPCVRCRAWLPLDEAPAPRGPPSRSGVTAPTRRPGVARSASRLLRSASHQGSSRHTRSSPGRRFAYRNSSRCPHSNVPAPHRKCNPSGPAAPPKSQPRRPLTPSNPNMPYTLGVITGIGFFASHEETGLTSSREIRQRCGVQEPTRRNLAK